MYIQQVMLDSGYLGSISAYQHITNKSANDDFYGFVKTRHPHADYLPQPSKKSSDSEFMLRFDIITYAAACYPYPFCRSDVMKNVDLHERKQQRILKALADDGFLQLHKRLHNKSPGANYKLNLSKFTDLKHLLETLDIKSSTYPQKNSDGHLEYLPKACILHKDDDSMAMPAYSGLSTSAEVRFSLLSYAAACYPYFFKRQETMVNLDINNRTQQRLFKSLVDDGFLEEKRNHPRVDYRLIPSSLECLKSLLDDADEREKNRLFK